MKAICVLGVIGLSGIFAPAGAADYVMHEWGTFTSVHGSDGVMLPGLQREEESLPHFVQAHDGMKVGPGGFVVGGKGWRRPLHHVTVKMETPVIYFYSEEGFTGSVEIGFRGGSISQWFPPRQGGETVPPRPLPKVVDGKLVLTDPEAGAIDFGGGKHEGSIRWDFEVMPPGPEWDGKVFRGGETLNWLRPRQTASNVVKAGDAYEKYLFYRGVGNFEMPVAFGIDSEETLHIRNAGSEAVPYALVFEMTEKGEVAFHEIAGGIAPGKSVSVAYDSMFPGGKANGAGFHVTPAGLGPVYRKMVAGLVASGLRQDESDAMVQTWWHSYFGKPGLRVFWVVPRGETARVLPLKITPEPKEMVRVLVGRSEVLRPKFERQLVAEFESEKKEAWNSRSLDRFGEAYAARVRALTGNPIAKAAAPGPFLLQTP